MRAHVQSELADDVKVDQRFRLASAKILDAHRSINEQGGVNNQLSIQQSPSMLQPDLDQLVRVDGIGYQG